MEFCNEMLILMSKENLVFHIEKDKEKWKQLITDHNKLVDGRTAMEEEVKTLKHELAQLKDEVKILEVKNTSLDNQVTVLNHFKVVNTNLKEEMNILKKQVEQLTEDLAQSNLLRDLFDGELKAREEEEAKQKSLRVLVFIYHDYNVIPIILLLLARIDDGKTFG